MTKKELLDELMRQSQIIGISADRELKLMTDKTILIDALNKVYSIAMGGTTKKSIEASRIIVKAINTVNTKDSIFYYSTDILNMSKEFASEFQNNLDAIIERIEELKSEERWADQYFKERESLAAENIKLREALKLYATFYPRKNTEGYYEICIEHGVGGENRFGTIARQVLESLKKDGY